MCPEMLISGGAQRAESYESTFDGVIQKLIPVFNAAYPSNEDEWCWIFLPYNIEYDFQTFNYTKLYIFQFSQAWISNCK